MLNEFLNRIDAQRRVLEIVNASAWNEPLLGLSAGALGRWCATNRLALDEPLAQHLHMIAEKLSLLANKSQEQITSEYATASTELGELTAHLPSLVHTYLSKVAERC